MSIDQPLLFLEKIRKSAADSGDHSSRYCTLATVEHGNYQQPRMRTLVIRQITREHCLLFINSTSEKNIKELEQACVELLFFYPSKMKQFRVRGKLGLLPEVEVRTHWQRKPRSAKLLDHFYTEFQKQSTLIDTRNNLDKGLDALSDRYPDSEPIPFSDSAIGLLVFADYVEIWSHSENSIHDRRLYLKKSEGWEEKIIVP